MSHETASGRTFAGQAHPWPHSSSDPTATKTLRANYAAEMYRRFRALKGAVRTAVIDRDVFGISGGENPSGPGTKTPAVQAAAARPYAANPLGPPEDPERFADFDTCVDTLVRENDDLTRDEAKRICGKWESNAAPAPAAATSTTTPALAAHQSGADINIDPPRPGAYDFPSDERKVSEFMSWVDEQVDRGILERSTFERREVAAAEPWQNLYLRDAYRKGVQHADAALVGEGIIAEAETIEAVFRAPQHADAAGMLFTRAFRELEGVTSAMEQDMSRELADGLLQGENPRKIARRLNDRVDNVGLHRGRLIARTETIRAHNEAALNRYDDVQSRIDGVTTLAEHLTAGDRRVCPICAGLAGSTYTVEDARGRIPVHPNCRCTWVPVRSGQAPAAAGTGPSGLPAGEGENA